MLNPGDKVLVGVSAGPDSVVLLHLLHTLAEVLSIRLGVAHLDHGLRPDAAAAEKDLVETLGRRLQVEVHSGRLDAAPPTGSLEEQLRDKRYAFFERTAAAHGFTKLALGHHADDNAEAILMHLLRGSGLRGLSGIPPVRDGWIVRPLIAARRAEILEYARRHSLDCLQDASNLDPRFERNRIRHELIPLLERCYNPNLVRTLNRSADLFREEEQWHTALSAPIARRILRQQDSERLELHIAPLRSAPRALQRHLLRAALSRWQGHLRRIGAGHIESLLALLEPGRTTRRLHLPFNVVAEATYGLLCLRRVARARQDRRAPPVGYRYQIPAPQADGWHLAVPEAQLVLTFTIDGALSPNSWRVPEQQAILLDFDRLTFPLTVRNFAAGDYVEPFGLGGRQKIAQLFSDRKIPRPHRERIPLLIGDGAVLWVIGVRRGRAAALSAETTRVLRVEAEIFQPEHTSYG